jgi:hypothetical protein
MIDNHIDVDVMELAERINDAARQSRSEEDVKMRTEYILRERVFSKLKIPWASYEYTFVSGQRPDALYGHVVIEYEKPKVLQTKTGFTHAIRQARDYIIEQAKTEESYPRYFGTVLDGLKIGFLRFRGRDKQWIVQGPYDINAATILRLVEAIRGLVRKPLDVGLLLADFGPESLLAAKVVRTLYYKVANWRSPRTDMLFTDWKKVFSQVCSYSPEKLAGLEQRYDLSGNIDPEKVLFAVHTYYALIMKLLAAEVAVLLGQPFLQSYIRKLEDAYLASADTLKVELNELEEGGIFLSMGVRNFLEADYFSWYLNEWDDEIAKATMEVVKTLSNYEVGTAELEPERIKDLFKRLYQGLVSEEIRHRLGEYYTPDWLAELVLDEVKYKGDPDRRLLDPACGSGTFLVLAIKRAKEFSEENFCDRGDLVEKVTKNIVGFDLNPLAVMASRANYLIALGEYVRERKIKEFEIPVYLADSILIEKEASIFGHNFVLHKAVGDFRVPVSIVEQGSFGSCLGILESCVKNRYTTQEFESRLKAEMPEVQAADAYTLTQLFEFLVKLEKEERNRIWIRLLKNSFAPLFEERFDYVVGNPPWIRWDELPQDYRERTRTVWEAYKLLSKSRGPGLGRVKKDLAMLFVTVPVSKYLSQSGTFGMLLPFTIFKTQAGAGFRKFLTTNTRVLKIDDVVELNPFEVAVNRTCLAVLTPGTTKFPIQATSWTKVKGKRIQSDATLEEVKARTNRARMVMRPIQGDQNPQSSWMLVRPKVSKAAEAILGVSSARYDAHEGVNTALNGVYWVEVLSKEPNGLMVQNLSTIGRKKVKAVTKVVDPEFVYPMARGRDVKKWAAFPSCHIIIPTDENGTQLDTSRMRVKYAMTYEFFEEFFQDLVTRGGEPYKSKLEPYRRTEAKLEQSKAPPFYWIFNVSPSLAPYKVAWKEIAGKISGKGEFSVAVIPPFEDRWLGIKPIICDHKLMIIPLYDEKEAYYVAAILNSSIVRAAVKGYTIETTMDTHITKHIRVPGFDGENPLHLQLAELSESAHELARKNEVSKLAKVERQLDKLVARVYADTEAQH